MSELTGDQEKFYKETFEKTKNQIMEIDQMIEDEIENFKKRMADLKNKRKLIKQVYKGAAILLNEPDEFEDEEEEGSEEI